MLERTVEEYEDPAEYWDSDVYRYASEENFGFRREDLGRLVKYRNRWTGKREGRETWYFQNSGIKRSEDIYVADEIILSTEWLSDGTVEYQSRTKDGVDEAREAPPWWGGVTDQPLGPDDGVEPHGVFRRYYFDTAILEQEESWWHGMREGLWTEWNPDGSIKHQSLFEADEQVDYRTEPPWREGSSPQQLTGDVVLGRVGQWWLGKLLDVESRSTLGRFFRNPRFDHVVTRFEAGQLEGVFAAYTDGRIVYSGRVRAGKPVGVHSSWRIDVEADESKRTVLRWQREYADDGTFEERFDDFVEPIEAAPRLEWIDDRVSGGPGALPLAPPLRRRPDEPPVWFFVDSSFVARGNYVDGQRHGVWTYWEPHADDRFQRRFQRGVLTEQRTEPPWWE